MAKTVFNPEKMYTYIRGFASALHMEQTLKALAFAREKHQGQFRKSGEPYIVHPLTMACDAMSIGIKDDNTIATILLHDVCEDCSVSLSEQVLKQSPNHGDTIVFGVSPEEGAADRKYLRVSLIWKNSRCLQRT